MRLISIKNARVDVIFRNAFFFGSIPPKRTVNLILLDVSNSQLEKNEKLIICYSFVR